MRSTAEPSKKLNNINEMPPNSDAPSEQLDDASDTVTRQAIIAKITEASGASTKEASEYVAEILSIFKDFLEKDGEVLVSGFGKFVTLKKGARNGRNPRTNEPVRIPSRTVLKFRAADKLKLILSQPPTM